jgi:hypothetical protein
MRADRSAPDGDRYQRTTLKYKLNQIRSNLIKLDQKFYQNSSTTQTNYHSNKLPGVFVPPAAGPACQTCGTFALRHRFLEGSRWHAIDQNGVLRAAHADGPACGWAPLIWVGARHGGAGNLDKSRTL